MVLAAVALLALPSGIARAEGPVLDQQAIDIARKSADFLAARPAMAFDWFVSYDEVEDGREKLTFMRSGANLLVRDKGFYSFVEDEGGVREYFFDGKVVTVSATEDGFYATGPFEGSFEELVAAMREDTGSDLPLYGLMMRNLAEGMGEGLDGAAYLGITRIAGREVHHLAFSDYDEDWQIWISTDEAEPVPIVIIGTDPYSQGWPQYRAYLTKWDFEPKPEEGVFVFTPGAEDEKIAFPDLKARSFGGAKAGEAAAEQSQTPPAQTGDAPASGSQPATGSTAN
jgi:hypothetical protein